MGESADRGRHASTRPHRRAVAGMLLFGAVAAGGVCFTLGYSLAPPAAASQMRSETTSARPTVTPTVVAPTTLSPSGGPTAAARSLRAVRDLSEGDTLLYYPTPFGEGSPCSFIRFESPSPKWARVDCGQGQVNVKVCDIASTTAYSRPGA